MNTKTTQILYALVLAFVGAAAQTNAGHALAAETPKPAGAEERAGIVKSVRGDVQLLSGGAQARPAAAGDAVAPIDRLQTGADSGASVVLRDGTTLVVGPSTRMDLKQFHFDSTTQDGGMLVSLLRGTLRMVTGLIGKTHPDAVRVETQSAVIGIRGTDFIVEVDPQP
ncbi:FecR family protein [Variovorax saccharolyticus]|uniref:FecR family protein n=1 Tax=Variovorax saccharolyticus TaxID=3053516 RepID=UPI002578C999|nr:MULTISPECIES: FecR domain-containing protein [unclassified Variovorax]MDM0020512.1 FecR domain-containing protein [Variovorax sp. J22R187]MDM0025948.1 FecR domain-containing protein [Variovorax sp. J31P216]